MTEQLWRGPEDCRVCGREHGLEPLLSSALVIEDGEGAAVERMLAAWDESWPERAGMEHLLRAACMEGR